MLKSYITRIVEEVIGKKNPVVDSKTLVSCKKCKLAIFKSESKKLGTYTSSMFGVNPWIIDYFCPSCAPAYDKVIDGRYYKTDVEVDENGKVIKK